MVLEKKVLINVIKGLNNLEEGNSSSAGFPVKNRDDIEELKGYLNNYNVTILSAEKHNYYALKISKKESK